MKDVANPYFNGTLSVRLGAIKTHSHAMSLIQSFLPPSVMKNNLTVFNSFFANQSMLIRDANGQIGEELPVLVKEELDEFPEDHIEGK